MRPYICEGFDQGLRPVAERFQAASARDAVARAQRANIVVTGVRLDWRQLVQGDIGARKPKAKDLALFTRQLGTMLRSGIPMVRSLRVLAELTEGSVLKKSALETARYVEEGNSLADALQRNAQVFPGTMLRMIAAAEYSGSLEQTLDQLADQFEQEEFFRSKFISAMTYPAIVTTIGFGAQIGVLTMILPKFAAIYKDLGTELPAVTQLLMHVSNFLIHDGWMVPFLIIALVLGLRTLVRRSNWLRGQFAQLALRLPIFGPLNRKRQAARFVRTFAGLYASGVPIVTALEYAAGTLTNVLMVDAVKEVAGRAAQGGVLAPSFRKSGLFPTIVVEMVAVGEETSELDTMLLKAASQCEQEVRVTLERLTSLLEPLLMVFLTAAVGAVLVPTMLPVLTMGSHMGQLGN